MDYNSLKYLGFDWDQANSQKAQKHGLSLEQIENFFQSNLFILPETRSLRFEKRLIAVGDLNGRPTYAIFTIRRSLIRVISARHMHIKEKKYYDALKTKKDS